MRCFIVVGSAVLFLLFFGGLVLSQEQQQPVPTSFACEEHAVDVTLDNHPGLKLVRLDGVPDQIIGGTEHKFHFDPKLSPFPEAVVYLSGEIPEDRVGRASQARLLVLVGTGSFDNLPYEQRKWWHLVPAQAVKPGDDRASHTLIFDANNMRPCFVQDDTAGQKCSFASVSQVAGKGVAILDLSFKQDQGGANANNWTESHVLLDLRVDPPRVLATADCGYNEGGGACTALDSGEMDRSDLRCDWAADKADFLCTETNSTGHHDRYLLNESEKAPLREGEVATLAEAAQRLLASRDANVSVKGLGSVRLVSEIQIGSRAVALLGATIGDGTRAQFFAVDRSGGTFSPPVNIPTQELMVDKESDSLEGSSNPEPNMWTVDQDLKFTFQEIYRREKLAVLQVTSATDQNTGNVYWIAIDASNGVARYGALRVASAEGTYAGCGSMAYAASVVKVNTIGKPFKASVVVQPFSIDVQGGDLKWGTSALSDDVVNDCLRNGTVQWTAQGFKATVQEGQCHRTAQPKYVRISRDGAVKLTDSTEP